MILPNQEWFLRISILGSIGIGLATPLVLVASKGMPMWLGTSIGENWGSVFPLFPYAGFQLAGAAWGTLYVWARRQEVEASFIRKTCRYCLALSVVSLAASFLPVPQVYSNFWTSDSAFFFLRLGTLGLLTVGFQMAEPRVLPHLNAIVVLGRESLVVYTGHLLLLHGSALNPDRNLLKLLGSARHVTEVTLALLFLIGATASLSWMWTRLKQNHSWGAKGIQLGLATYLLYAFLKR
jgi:hypothetical protein